MTVKLVGGPCPPAPPASVISKGTGRPFTSVGLGILLYRGFYEGETPSNSPGRETRTSNLVLIGDYAKIRVVSMCYCCVFNLKIGRF